MAYALAFHSYAVLYKYFWNSINISLISSAFPPNFSMPSSCDWNFVASKTGSFDWSRAILSGIIYFEREWNPALSIKPNF